LHLVEVKDAVNHGPSGLLIIPVRRHHHKAVFGCRPDACGGCRIVLQGLGMQGVGTHDRFRGSLNEQLWGQGIQRRVQQQRICPGNSAELWATKGQGAAIHDDSPVALRDLAQHRLTCCHG